MHERNITQGEMRALLKEQADRILKLRPGKPAPGARKRAWKAKKRRVRLARNALLSPTAPAPERQFVYVIGCAGHPVKVGIAVDVERRLKALQTGFPHRLRVYYHVEVGDRMARQVERECHVRLDAYRLNGEWFDIDPRDAFLVVQGVINEF